MEEVVEEVGEEYTEEVVTRPPGPPPRSGPQKPGPPGPRKPAPRPVVEDDEGAPASGKASVVDMILAIVALLVMIGLVIVLFRLT